MENSIDLQVVISAVDEASKVLQDIQKKAGTLGKQFTAVGAAMAGALGYTVNSAAEAQAEMAKFQATIKSMGKVGEEAEGTILKLSDKMLKLGFDNEEAANSLAKLTQKTGDLEYAWELQQIAMDLARDKAISLTDASAAVGMVMSGNTKILKQYGIAVDETATLEGQLQELAVKVGGQAQAFATSFAGGTEILKQQFSELTEAIGAQLLPILQQVLAQVTPLIEKVIAWTQAHPELTKNIVMATAALAGLLLVLGPVLIAFSAISGPGLALIAIVAALGYGIFQLITHWEQVKVAMEPVLAVFRTIGQVASAVLKPAFDFLVFQLKLLWQQLKVLWDILEPVLLPILKWLAIALGTTLVVAIGALAVSIGAIALVISGFIQGLTLLIDKIKVLWSWFRDTLPSSLKTLGEQWSAEWNKMKEGATVVIDYVLKKLEALKAAWEKAKEAANAIGEKASEAGSKAKSAVSSAISKVTGKKAMGGAVSSGGSYLVGENGPEIFSPNANGVISPNSRVGTSVVVNINGGTYLSEDVAKKMGDMIISQFRRTVRI
jgi:hypothetical protein